MSTTTSRPRKQWTGKKRKPGEAAASRESLKVIAFDSAGDRKFALQLQKAKNGNPCLRIVQGAPQKDGSYRKFDLTFWSEDFESLFDALDEMRSYIDEKNIRTPADHNWKPQSGRK